jgi:alkaline phosphatase
VKTKKQLFRILAVLVSLSLVATIFLGSPQAQARPITLTIDGRPLATDVEPIMVNRTPMIPMRIVFESLGADVSWENATGTVVAVDGDMVVRVRVGERFAIVNENTVPLPEVARVENGRIFVPFALVEIAFDVDTKWDSTTNIALIFTAKGPRNVIFIHPDGTTPEYFTAARMLHYGPDGELNWDRMPATAVYKGHMKDNLVGTSNGGAVTHAYGVKVHARSYGLDEAGTAVVARSGKSITILEEAKAAGFSVGLINTGTITEPGTGVWGARVTNRSDHAGIAREIIMRPDDQLVDVIFGGGEVWFLPNTEVGRHGFPGRRTDGLNLVTVARERGYTVIYTKEELLNLPAGTTKVLGLFAGFDTYNDNNEEASPQPFGYPYTEEQLRAEGLQDYDPNAPTFAQMMAAAIKILSRNQTMGFYLVAEEEGTDNLSNFALNARGTIEATKRADDGIGVAIDFAAKNPDTLVITASDSEASGLSIIGNPPLTAGNVTPTRSLRARDDSVYFVEYLDGRDGTNTPPFMSAPDRNGQRWPFAISWSSRADHSGSIVARAFGRYSEMLSGTIDNTDIYRIKFRVLFGRVLP